MGYELWEKRKTKNGEWVNRETNDGERGRSGELSVRPVPIIHATFRKDSKVNDHHDMSRQEISTGFRGL